MCVCVCVCACVFVFWGWGWVGLGGIGWEGGSISGGGGKSVPGARLRRRARVIHAWLGGMLLLSLSACHQQQDVDLISIATTNNPTPHAARRRWGVDMTVAGTRPSAATKAYTDFLMDVADAGGQVGL